MRDIVHQREDGSWCYWDETWSFEEGHYSTKEEATVAASKYFKELEEYEAKRYQQHLCTGDEGQRYEIRAKDPEKESAEIVVGWSATLDGAKSFVEGIVLHPSLHSPRIIDRKE